MSTAQLSDFCDVETIKDFFQYYRGRYLGYRPNLGESEIFPAIIPENAERQPAPTHIGLRYYDPGYKPNSDEHQLQLLNVPFKNMSNGHYAFGAPILGTTLFGPTYGYFLGFPLRESVKGIATHKLTFVVPNHTFFSKYARGTKEKSKYLSAIDGRHFGYPSEMELVYWIYNKKYYSFVQAWQMLHKGERLGCPLSRNIGLFLDEGNPNIGITFKDRPIGIVSDNADQVVLNEEEKHLVPAIETAFKTINYNLQII